MDYRMIKFFDVNNKKLTLVKMLLVALPSYAVALTTEKVFYVIPTIAMMMMVAHSVESGIMSNRNRVDEDGGLVDDATSDGLGESDGGV
jgi:hypothetical protein|tara:strand:+ start:431 stop:697 length:267 start_codon:yes stop_codon:yes gene_type:complete